MNIEDYNVYTTVPCDTDHDDNDKVRVLCFLQDNEGNVFTAGEIAKNCEIEKSYTGVKVRKIITELLLETEPIIATSKGYKYTYDKQELQDYLESLQLRIDGIRRRMRAIGKVLEGLE